MVNILEGDRILMKRKSKATILLLTVIIVLAVLPGSAFAECGTELVINSDIENGATGGHSFVQDGIWTLPLYETSNTNFNFNQSLDHINGTDTRLDDLTVGSLIEYGAGGADQDNYSFFIVAHKEGGNQSLFGHRNIDGAAAPFRWVTYRNIWDDVTVTARGVCWSTSANPTTADSNITGLIGKTRKGGA